MTTLRPERPADGPMSYDDTGQFRAVVEQLDDPLNDPLPGRPPAVPQPERHGRPAQHTPAPEAPAGAQEQPSAQPTSPWFRSAGRGHTEAPPAHHGQAVSAHPAQGATPYQQAQPAAGPYAGAHQAPVAEPFAGPQAVPVADPFAEQPQSVPTAEPYAGAGPAPAADSYAEAPAVPRAEPYAAPAQPAPVSEPYAGQRRPAAEPYPGPAAVPVAEHYSDPRPGQEAVGETAQLPVVGEPDAGTGEPEAQEDQQLAPPPDGGRAARRKAAARQGGGGHRARSRAAAGTAPAGSAEQPSAPLSRVEARRAAKAAKDSPAVVLSRIVGELFITAGVVMLLFVTYQLWWTNVRAHQQANSASNNLEHQWDTTAQDPNRAPGTFSPGQGFAIMYIPKLDVKAPIAQGVSKTKVLDHGMIGHYDGSLNTAMPWDKTGNFAVAAHRNTHGEPFRYINHLTPGDKVVVETATTYYTYVVTSSLASTPPTNTSVLNPIPTGSGFTKPGRYITLTTCTPEFTSENRLIVWGKLVEERPRSKGKPDALVKG